MMRHTEGVWSFQSLSMEQKIVSACVCVCVCGSSKASLIHWVTMCLPNSSSIHRSSVSSGLLISSLSGFLERRSLKLMSFFPPLPTHFVFVIFPYSFHLPFFLLHTNTSFLSTFCFLSFPILFLLWPILPLSCSVVAEVCSSLLFLSVWADVRHLSNPWNIDR